MMNDAFACSFPVDADMSTNVVDNLGVKLMKKRKEKSALPFQTRKFGTNFKHQQSSTGARSERFPKNQSNMRSSRSDSEERILTFKTTSTATSSAMRPAKSGSILAKTVTERRMMSLSVHCLKWLEILSINRDCAASSNTSYKTASIGRWVKEIVERQLYYLIEKLVVASNCHPHWHRIVLPYPIRRLHVADEQYDSSYLVHRTNCDSNWIRLLEGRRGLDSLWPKEQNWPWLYPVRIAPSLWWVHIFTFQLFSGLFTGIRWWFVPKRWRCVSA